MTSNRRDQGGSDESPSSIATGYSFESYTTDATSAWSGPESGDKRWGPILSTHPIMPSDPICRAWNEAGLREKVMALVRAQSTWQSVDVLRRGWSERPLQCPPMIFVCITPGTMSEAWKQVGRQIETYLRDYALSAGMAILESEAHRADTVEAKDGIALGASIGVKNGASTGTLGGYVQLDKDGAQRKICAMTCHHVVAPQEPSSTRKRDLVLYL